MYPNIIIQSNNNLSFIEVNVFIVLLNSMPILITLHEMILVIIQCRMSHDVIQNCIIDHI